MITTVFVLILIAFPVFLANIRTCIDDRGRSFNIVRELTSFAGWKERQITLKNAESQSAGGWSQLFKITEKN